MKRSHEMMLAGDSDPLFDEDFGQAFWQDWLERDRTDTVGTPTVNPPTVLEQMPPPIPSFSPFDPTYDPPTFHPFDFGTQLEPLFPELSGLPLPSQQTTFTDLGSGSLSGAFGQTPLLEMPRPKDKRGTPPVTNSLMQPVREFAPIETQDETDYDALYGRLVQLDRTSLPDAPSTPGSPRAHRVDLQTYDNPSKIPSLIEKKVPNSKMSGSNQSGRHLSTDKGELPEGANYQGQYSSRVLSYLSTVSRTALELDGVPPIEVQYGHAFNDEGDYGLFGSTNNLTSQAHLHGLLEDPSAMVSRVAEKGDETSRKHAMKLLLWPELQERRRDAIQQDLKSQTIDEKEAQARLWDLELADKAHAAFTGSDVTVAMAGANKTERGLETDELLKAGKKQRDVVKTKENPSQTQRRDVRHAEQNVATAMHDENEDRNRPFTHADIQGTMIRCTGCANMVGFNAKHEGTCIAGRTFARQADPDSFIEDAIQKLADTRRTVPKTNSVRMPGSPGSPPPSPQEKE